MTYIEAREAIEAGKFVTRPDWLTGTGIDFQAEYLGKDELGLFWRTGGFRKHYRSWVTVTADVAQPTTEELKATDWQVFEPPTLYTP